jgi:hypothetical protein
MAGFYVYPIALSACPNAANIAYNVLMINTFDGSIHCNLILLFNLKAEQRLLFVFQCERDLNMSRNIE